ncbi:hypothetical protein FEM48_Zijuj09G0195600 [Ziziphus jujuba var. spinosa]|uniref:Non-haem dioxygenase N-terminal domain-containing protein n=1 Tax=Ziziphus jujuba var. spinosa TaxID=714518 RepID=A0A978UUX0_ZIZJJ|nr:hypothetical protein FEM48_Zijuj09G0195600 [Ziziphus jujuba var. spinosa]
MSVKSLAESLNLTTIPSTYTFINNPRDLETVDLDNPDEQIPIIDFSLLYSSNPHQRSKVISDLGKACEDWGFFMVINHGVPKEVMDSIIEGCRGFFNLSEEEKLEFKGKQVSDPIRYGTSFHASAEEVFFWRDFLKVIVHPQFHPVNKPPGFSEVCFDYCKKTEKLTQKLLEGISESLGLEANYIDKAMNILSNGKYKSVVHRAVVNNRATRISVAIANGPSLETVVSPAPKLVDNEAHPPAFIGIKYKDYFQIQQANKLHRKSCLDSLRI